MSGQETDARPGRPSVRVHIDFVHIYDAVVRDACAPYRRRRGTAVSAACVSERVARVSPYAIRSATDRGDV